MNETGPMHDGPLEGWDPRRRAALEAAWNLFERAAGDSSLSDELIDERHQKAAAEDAWLEGRSAGPLPGESYNGEGSA